MTATKRRVKPLTVTVETPDKLPRSAILRGPARAIYPALQDSGCPWQHCPEEHGYKVPRDARLDDVLARIELAGYCVDIPLPGWS